MQQQSIGAYLRASAGELGDRPVVSVGDRTMTWAELDRASDQLARVLLERGVVPDDFVSIVLPNGFAFTVSAVAIWKVGATPQLLSPRMPPTELHELLALARPSAIVAVQPVATQVPVVDPGSLAGNEAIVLPDPPPAPRRWGAFASGGSTGRPKIVLADMPGTYGDGSEIALGADSYNIDAATVILLPGPLYHNGPFGLHTFTLCERGQIVLMERFDPEATLDAVARHGVTTMFLVPTMMSRILKLPPEVRARYDMSSLRAVWHAAAPCPPWVKQQWIDWVGAEHVFESYGASDSAGMTRITGTEWLEHRGSVGRCYVGDLAIFDEDGNELPPGEVGDVYMRPPAGTMARTYLGADPPVARDGWWTVGDMGSVDEDGYLYLADRRVDLIITGGVNVYPAEVEGALEAHPAVVSCAVVGVPDDDLGKRVHAVVQLAEPVGEEDLAAFVRTRLAGYKVPKTFELVDGPVRDDAGKVRRSALAARVTADDAGRLDH